MRILWLAFGAFALMRVVGSANIQGACSEGEGVAVFPEESVAG